LRFAVLAFGFVESTRSFRMVRTHSARLVLLVSAFCFPVSVSADLVASDNASSSAYNDGWQVGDNGGSGFNAWSTINNSGGGFGGGFLSTGNLAAVNIGTGGNNAAWGVFGNNGGTGNAVRPFPTPLVVGQTFHISMDNQSIDTGGTVGFGLRAPNNANLFEFYFIGGQTNYTVNALNVSGTTPGFTQGGLRLAFSLTASNAFTFTMDTLSNGVGTDHTVTGNLLANVDQSVSSLRMFNANGGPDVFFNSISAVPEVSPMVAVPAALAIAGVVSLGWRRWKAATAVRKAG
jgi:hypothetical protein